VTIQRLQFVQETDQMLETAAQPILTNRVSLP